MIPRTAKKDARMLIAATVALAFYLLIPPLPARAISGDGLIAYPTNADSDNDLSQTWFIYELPAGESKQDSLTLKNDSKESVSVSLYAVDSTTNNMGEFALEDEKASRDAIGRWIELETGHLTLKPGEERQISFTIRIPEDAPAGETSGGIIIQKDLTEAQKNAKSGFVISTRIGIRVYETVPGETVRKAILREARIEYDEKDKKYIYTLLARNEGNVSLESTVKLELKDKYFKKQDRTFEQKVLIPRGEEQKIVFTVDENMFGVFEASSQMSYRKGNGAEETIATPAPMPFFAYPKSLLPVLGLLLLLNLLFLAMLRIRRAREKKYRIEYTVGAGDNLADLSSRFGMGWKKIVKLNRLKPPYQLEEGQTIFLTDKNRVLTPDAKKIPEILSPGDKLTRKKRQEAFDQDLALISDGRNAFPPLGGAPSRRNRFSKKIWPALLLGAGLYLVYTGVVLRGNDAQFVYEGTKNTDKVQETPAENPAASQIEPSGTPSDVDASPASSPADTTEDEEESAEERGAVKIEILNGSGTKGAGAQAAALFRSHGYSSITTGNADRFDYAKTLIRCGSSVGATLCQEANNLISADYPRTQSEAAISGDDTATITIILGK